MSPQENIAKGPERVAYVLLTFVILIASFADDMEYGKSYRKDNTIFQDVLHGTALAPAQYRVGVLRIADLLGRHSPLPMRHWITILGALSAFAAVFALFALLRRSSFWQAAALKDRWFAALGFVFLVQFYLGWITDFQRPETLPTAAFVALSLFLVTVPLPAFGAIAASAGLILLAFLQGFVRADAAIAINAGIILLCLTSTTTGLALKRIPQIVTSVVAAGVAFGVQFYFMHMVYPQATYGGTPMIQLLLNLKTVGEWMAFFLFMLPVFWTLFQVLVRRVPVDYSARAMTFAAVIYLGLWLTFGRMEEVRIYVPFALALAPCTIAVALQRFLGAASGTQMKPQAVEP